MQLRRCETRMFCSRCPPGERVPAAEYAVEVDGSLAPLCWLCAIPERSGHARLVELLPRRGRCAVDGGRASGEVLCDVCGRKYYDHPAAQPEYSFLTELCDGTLVKL